MSAVLVPDVHAERLTHAVGSHADPPTPLGTHVVDFRPFLPTARAPRSRLGSTDGDGAHARTRARCAVLDLGCGSLHRKAAPVTTRLARKSVRAAVQSSQSCTGRALVREFIGHRGKEGVGGAVKREMNGDYRETADFFHSLRYGTNTWLTIECDIAAGWRIE